MPQKKFGQFHLTLWFPEPTGGRWEYFTDKNKDDAAFRAGIRDMIGYLQRFAPAEPPDEPMKRPACGLLDTVGGGFPEV